MTSHRCMKRRGRMAAALMCWPVRRSGGAIRDAEKARLVAAALSRGRASRRGTAAWGASAGSLCWRRLARQGRLALPAEDDADVRAGAGHAVRGRSPALDANAAPADGCAAEVIVELGDLRLRIGRMCRQRGSRRWWRRYARD